ncbi:MAG TPA: hypothetical protein PL009_08630 [Flavipsychrobacter sp.]|nr:hypothetical protein [Flavipsychrobacter sp.]
MKSFLLAASAVLLSGTVYAQSYEVGINAGVSTTTKPHKSLYQGNNNVYNYAAEVNFKYNLTERWQMGVAVGLTKWQRKDEWALSNANNMSLGDQEVRLVLAKNAVSFALQLNHVIPFYEQYEDFVRSALYFGVSAGAVVVGNDGKVNYSRVNPNTPAEYTYASQYNFEGGYGALLGFQVGYTYYLSERIGLNFDIAPKVAWVGTNDTRQARGNSDYNLWYIPTTVGLHIRFGSSRY